MFSGKKGGTGSGMTDDQGKYSAVVPVGDSKVAVLPPPGNKLPIFVKYNPAKTPLSKDVKSGSNELDIDLK